MSLNTQTNKISGVINLPPCVSTKKQIDNFLSSLKSFCGVYCKEYYIIFHNRDINSNGEFKTPHFHILLDTTDVSDRKRLSTHLNEMAQALNVDTACISLDTWRNYDLGIQYLIHKNDKEKVAYSSTEIITNQSSDYLKIILEKEYSENITIDYLISLVSSCDTLTDIYCKLGLANSKKYRYVINDLFLEKIKKLRI